VPSWTVKSWVTAWSLDVRISYNRDMAISTSWYRENAGACARRAEQSRNLFAKRAYREMVHAWLILAASAEELARDSRHELRVEERAALAA